MSGRSDVATRRADVVVIGDGPAGSALAAACQRRGVDVVLVGDGAPWTATYGVWIDDLDGSVVAPDAAVFAARIDSVSVFGDRRHDLGRPYGVLDNGALAAVLLEGVERIVDRADSVRTGVTHHSVGLAGGGRVRGRLVVDATGRAPGPGDEPAWQTAFGVVLPEPPAGALGRPTLMDFRPVGAPAVEPAIPTFGYALPVADGWLVEETVLAARPPVDPQPLLERLAARLGRAPDDLRAVAIRTETVRIPMGGPLPGRDRVVVPFGAAAGYVHPATGFSVSASLRAAPRVADAIAAAVDSPSELAADPRPVIDAVWPVAARRTRALHDYGLELLTGLDGPALREFFDRFFELPTERWAAYLRVDASPVEVSRTMTGLFRSSSWSLRRRLASGNPLPLAAALRR